LYLFQLVREQQRLPVVLLIFERNKSRKNSDLCRLFGKAGTVALGKMGQEDGREFDVRQTASLKQV
jgi:hypothetical protein